MVYGFWVAVWPGIAAIDAANPASATKQALKLVSFMVFLPVFPAQPVMDCAILVG
ncbi:hypothetical protein MesoLj131c_04980 [Mesorhizobium sp. 131-3-5]|nr:hypothetical protein MesoLj131c_04980 [Mesorhizobium sp. 131-3-5]